MQKPELRRKNIPGTRDLIGQIKQLTQDILALDEKIRTFQDEYQRARTEERENSPQTRLLNAIKELSVNKEGIKREKREMHNKIDDGRRRIEELRMTMKGITGGYDTIEKIDRAIEDLELRLISTSMSAKQESEIANNMVTLRSQRNRLTVVEETVAQIQELETTLRGHRDRLAGVAKDLNETSTRLEEMKAELDKVREEGRASKKSPELERLEQKLGALRSERTEAIGQRNQKREEVHKLEEEYSKFEAELLVQRALEEQKDLIRKRMNALRVEKEDLEDEQSAHDPKIYDSLIFTVERMRKSGVFSLGIDLVTQLMKNGILIPRRIEDLGATIEALGARKQESRALYEVKMGKMGDLIRDIENKIRDEKGKLDAMPETDYELLKRGGVRNVRNK